MDLKERFLKYVSYDTQSSEESDDIPLDRKTEGPPGGPARRDGGLGHDRGHDGPVRLRDGHRPRLERVRERPRHRLHRPRRHLARHERQGGETPRDRRVRRRRHRPERPADDAGCGLPRAGLLQGPHPDPHRRHDAAGRRRQGRRCGDYDRRGIPHGAPRGETRQDPHRLHPRRGGGPRRGFLRREGLRRRFRLHGRRRHGGRTGV